METTRPAGEPPARTREADLTPQQLRVARRSVAGSAIGNAIEWFDYGIYGYLVTLSLIHI